MKFKRFFSRNSGFGWLLAAGAIAIFTSPAVRRKIRKYIVKGTAMLMEMTDRFKQGTKTTIAPTIPIKENFEFGTDFPQHQSTGMITVELSTPANEESKS